MIARGPAIVGGLSHWHQAALAAEQGASVSHDALQVLAAVIVWIVIALLLRRPLSSWTPWLGTGMLAAVYVAINLWTRQRPGAGMPLREAARDLGLTILLPTLLLIAARARPDLFRQSPGARRWPRRG